MPGGIIIFGAMGVGDTTLGKEVAKRLNYPHVDLDDHHWRWDTEIPYTVFRSREERTESIMQAISENPHFVMSGSMWSIRKAFEPLFDMAVFMTAPAEIRAERLRTRSVTRWGNRVFPGGDMYESSDVYKDYLACAKSYDQDISPNMCMAQHEQWVKELPCPVLRVNGTKPIAENAELVVTQYNKINLLGENTMQKKALVIIDIQNDITKNYKDVIGNINKAIDWAVNQNIHVVYIRHENLSAGTRTFKPNTYGAELASDMKTVSKNVFTKYKGNALSCEEFADFISKNEICDFYIAGADAVACVKSTCYNLCKANYGVNVLSDCVTSYDKRKIDEMLRYYESVGSKIICLNDLLTQ